MAERRESQAKSQTSTIFHFAVDARGEKWYKWGYGMVQRTHCVGGDAVVVRRVVYGGGGGGGAVFEANGYAGAEFCAGGECGGDGVYLVYGADAVCGGFDEGGGMGEVGERGGVFRGDGACVFD